MGGSAYREGGQELVGRTRFTKMQEGWIRTGKQFINDRDSWRGC